MSLRKPVFYEYELDKKQRLDLITVGHTDNCNSDAIELRLVQNGEPVDVAGATVTARYVMRKTKILINDSVACAVNERGNILVPFDNAAVSTQTGDMDIEVSLADGNDVLTLQFPLWVRVRGSILDTAELSPESKGKIADLLERVEEELERIITIEGVTPEKVYQMLDETLSGSASIVPSLLVVSKGSSYALVYEDSDDVEHELFDFANLPVPAKTSELQNDSGFITSADISGKADKSEIPTKTSDLTNDSGFLTAHQSLSNYYTKAQTDSAIQTAIGGIENGSY